MENHRLETFRFLSRA